MKKSTIILSLGFAVILVATSGCSKSQDQQPVAAQNQDSVAFQGKWTGQEAQANTEEAPVLTFSGANLELHEANTNIWYKASFTLHEDTTPKQLIVVITECADPKYVGRTANAIYKLEKEVLTISANEPGNPTVPTSFNDKNSRNVVFKR